jgi:hypothetical protein
LLGRPIALIGRAAKAAAARTILAGKHCTKRFFRNLRVVCHIFLLFRKILA